MIVTASGNHTLDLLLELICVGIQITPTQDKEARRHYATATDWLSREGSSLRRYHPHIFPQGSQRLGTTTKPIGQNEFDLDAICKLDISGSVHPGELYRLIWDRLKSHEVYGSMMERLPRCIRLTYSDNFHLDIAPAIPDRRWGGEVILVPDLQANLALDHPTNNQWKSTNPVGYAGWFEDQCVPVWTFMERQASAKVDPVPDREPIHEKPSLKRSVQLFKRWRDVEYQNRRSLSPPSIILTTLCGHYYEGKPLCTDALTSVLEATVRRIESGDRLCLSNPAHPAENICEKWESSPESFADFAVAVRDFRDRWRGLQNKTNLSEIERELSDLFGETPAHWAIKEVAKGRIIRPREEGTLRVHPRQSGLLSTMSASSLAIRPNTFHGDDSH